jgi:hypothetical protein
MARNSGEKASNLLRLSQRFNEVIAFEFDLACTSRLQVYDEEKEARLFEALGVGSVNRALGGSAPMKERGPAIIEAGWQVPDA